MFDPRQWGFVADMNYTGSITISDVSLWFKWLYFYPGDGLVYFSINRVPKFGQFFEISYNSYGGNVSGIVSFFVWIIVLGILAAILDNLEVMKTEIISSIKDIKLQLSEKYSSIMFGIVEIEVINPYIILLT